MSESGAWVGRCIVQRVISSQVPSDESAPAFSKMSKHIRDASGEGFSAGYRVGWGVHPATRRVVRNLTAGANAPRVDLELHRGRAFGDW